MRVVAQIVVIRNNVITFAHGPLVPELSQGNRVLPERNQRIVPHDSCFCVLTTFFNEIIIYIFSIISRDSRSK